MKQLTWKFILPLTIISFSVFTKWWRVYIDGYEEIMRGFPLPFVCPGWHTSLSLQIFVFELIIDLGVYLAFWLLVIGILHRNLKSLHVPMPVTIALLLMSGIFTFFLLLFALNPDNIYESKNPFNMKILDSGYRFMWQQEKSLVNEEKTESK